MILRRLDFPGTNGLIFRRVYDDLKKNHIDKILDEFPGLAKYYSASNHEIIIPHERGIKSKIVFGYAENEQELNRKFWGQEYMDIFVDQGEQLTEKEHRLLKSSNRWPNMPMHACKYCVFFNPGGIGIDFLKRIFFEKNYKEAEIKDDYYFLQAYGWDNVEWVRPALEEDGLTEKDFYSWGGEVGGQRFKYFIERSQYGRELNALPHSLRIGHLLGSLDKFAGQYFDNFDTEIHGLLSYQMEIKAWHSKWLSIDWGYAHDAAIYWNSQEGPVTKTYDELVINNTGPRALAQMIVDRVKARSEKIEAVYLSPDAYAHRTDEDTIAEQMDKIFRQNGIPSCTPADNDRVGGWMLMRELLEYRQWIIATDKCPKLIRTIPLLTRDEAKMEDCVKFDGDDPADSARYALKTRHSAGRPPIDEIVMARLATLAKSGAVPEADVHSRYLLHQKFTNEEKKKNQVIRSWHRRRSYQRHMMN